MILRRRSGGDPAQVLSEVLAWRSWRCPVSEVLVRKLLLNAWAGDSPAEILVRSSKRCFYRAILRNVNWGPGLTSSSGGIVSRRFPQHCLVWTEIYMLLCRKPYCCHMLAQMWMLLRNAIFMGGARMMWTIYFIFWQHVHGGVRNQNLSQDWMVYSIYFFKSKKCGRQSTFETDKCGPFFGRSWVSPASVHTNRCSLKAPAPPNSWHWQFLGLTITPSAKAVDNLSWATVIDISKGPILGKRTADWMQVICKQNLVKGRCFRRFCTKCTRATIKCYFPSLICKIKWHGFMLNSCDTGNTKLYVTYLT